MWRLRYELQGLQVFKKKKIRGKHENGVNGKETKKDRSVRNTANLLETTSEGFVPMPKHGYEMKGAAVQVP